MYIWERKNIKLFAIFLYLQHDFLSIIIIIILAYFTLNSVEFLFFFSLILSIGSYRGPRGTHIARPYKERLVVLFLDVSFRKRVNAHYARDGWMGVQEAFQYPLTSPLRPT